MEKLAYRKKVQEANRHLAHSMETIDRIGEFFKNQDNARAKLLAFYLKGARDYLDITREIIKMDENKAGLELERLEKRNGSTNKENSQGVHREG